MVKNGTRWVARPEPPSTHDSVNSKGFHHHVKDPFEGQTNLSLLALGSMKDKNQAESLNGHDNQLWWTSARSFDRSYRQAKGHGFIASRSHRIRVC